MRGKGPVTDLVTIADLRIFLVLAVVVVGLAYVAYRLRQYEAHVSSTEFTRLFKKLPKIETGTRKRF